MPGATRPGPGAAGLPVPSASGLSGLRQWKPAEAGTTGSPEPTPQQDLRRDGSGWAVGRGGARKGGAGRRDDVGGPSG